MEHKYKYRLKGIVAGVGLLLLASPLSSAFAALTVTSPSTVLMIDGVGDNNTTVQITALDATFPISEYQFGFLTGGGFTSITSLLDWTYTFNGGDVVDFALREIASDTVYDIADPLDYANQIYSFSIDPSNSQNPAVTSPYYHALTIAWDLNHDGYADPGFGFAITPVLTNDGMAPTVVPLPAAAWLLGSGLLGLGALTRRRRST